MKRKPTSPPKVPHLGEAKALGWYRVRLRRGTPTVSDSGSVWFMKGTELEAIKVSVSGGYYGGKGSRPRVYYIVPGHLVSIGLRAVDVTSAVPLETEG